MTDGWWYRASQADKLRQVDAGIELGLTGYQMALVCGVAGARRSIVQKFALYHGRHFARDDAATSAKRVDHRYGTPNRRKAYLRGDAPETFDQPAPDADIVAELSFR